MDYGYIHTALARLLKHTIQLAPTALIENGYEKSKTKGWHRQLPVQKDMRQRINIKVLFEQLMNTLYTHMKGIGTFQPHMGT